MNPVIQSPCYVNSHKTLQSFELWMEANLEAVEDYFEELTGESDCDIDYFAKVQYEVQLFITEDMRAEPSFYSWQERDADAAGVPLQGEL